MAWFGISDIDLSAELRIIRQSLGAIVASIDQVRADYKAWGTEVKAQRDAALAALEAKTAEASQLASDLADFQANDAATDASQLAEQAQSIADGLQSDLDSLKDQPEPTEPTDGPPADQPPADQPGDVATDTPAEETPAEQPTGRGRGKSR